MGHTVLLTKKNHGLSTPPRAKPLRNRAIVYYLMYILSALRMGRREEPAEPAQTWRNIIRTGHTGLRGRALPYFHGSYRRSNRRAALDRPWDGGTRCGRRDVVSGCTRVPGG